MSPILQEHIEDGEYYVDGIRRWFVDNELHREDGPAVVMDNGSEFWFKDGKRHRIGGPAAIVPSGINGDNESGEGWYLDGVSHRLDGPSTTYDDGSTLWCVYGQIVDSEREQSWLTFLFAGVHDEQRS